MSVIVEYLDAAKKKLGIESDYALASALQVNRSTVSMYRSGGRKKMPLRIRLQIAKILELDPTAVVAEIEMESARTPEAKQWWVNFLKRHRSAVGALALCGAGLMALVWRGEPAWAETRSFIVESVYYVKSIQVSDRSGMRRLDPGFSLAGFLAFHPPHHPALVDVGSQPTRL